jgi:hypothetical protein
MVIEVYMTGSSRPITNLDFPQSGHANVEGDY